MVERHEQDGDGADPAAVALPRRAPSIIDVAAAANVSYQTVSRVLNAHPSVRPETRQAVLDAVERLDYRPSNAARTLKTGRSRTLGALVLDIEDSDGLTSLYGIEHGARELGYFVGIGALESVDRGSIQAATGRLAEQAIAGLLIIAPIAAAEDALLGLPPTLPVVAIEGGSQPDVSSVGIDQLAGARAATEHLLALGHRTVFHVGGPSEWMQTRDRLTGWRQALEAAGAEVPPALPGDWTAQSGYEAGLLLSRMSDMTAVFASNDQMALGMMLAFSERGLSVPGDVSVVGYDDGADAPYYNPPLTTVRQDFREVGRRAIELLVSQIENGRAPAQQILVAPELIMRRSTGPAKS